MPNAIQENIERLRTLTAGLFDALNVENRRAELERQLEERGYGPRGPFKHAPPNVLEQQARDIIAGKNDV